MKIILKLALFLFAIQITNSQTTLTDYFIVSSDRIEIEISKVDGKYKIKLSKEGVDPEEFIIGSSVGSFFDFKKQFRDKVYVSLLGKPIPAVKSSDKNAYARIDQEAESVYYNFANNLRVLDNLDYKPNTGDLKVNDRIPVYLSKDNFEKLEKGYDTKAKRYFKEMIDKLKTSVQSTKTDYLDNINKQEVYNYLPNIKSICESPRSVNEKDSEIKQYTNLLDFNSDEYKKLEETYVSNYYSEIRMNKVYSKDNLIYTYLIIDNVEFEFSRGFLEMIKVSGTFDCDSDESNYNCELIPSFMKNDAKMVFTNKYGIGFTSRKNYRKLENVGLHLNQLDKKYTIDNFENLNLENKVYKENIKGGMFLLMDDLINYNFYINKLTRDFSPMDQGIKVEGGEKLTLTKEETRKILEVEVFSDFEGFDVDTPNGLIQFELSKNFNINTKRMDFLGGGIGFFQYTEIAGGITKIEDKQRRLNPERIDTEMTLADNSMVIDAKRYTTTVGLLNYSTWNVGQDINLALFDNPDFKYQFHINGGLRFNKTAVQDSIKTVGSEVLIPQEYSVNFWTFYPEIKMHLLPEERYGFYAMWRPKYVYLTSDKISFKSEANPLTGFRRKMSNWVNEFEFKGYVDTGSKGQLFLRWRLSHEMGYSANNFSQIQLGYSFFIFGRNETSSKPN